MSEAIEKMPSDTEARALRQLEIESLLRSSRDAIYQRAVSAPRKPSGSFAKTPLIDLAKQAQLRAADDKQTTQDATPEMQEAPLATEADQGVSIDNPVQDLLQDGETQSTDADDDIAAAAAKLENDDDIDVELPTQTTADIVEEEGNTEIAAPEADTVSDPVPSPKTLAAEPNIDDYNRGFAEGQAAARAELAEAAQSFATLMNSLSAEDPIASETLETELRQAVLHIAAERAGMAISELPERFARKIQHLVQMVNQSGQNLTISLNPDDRAAILPHLEQATPALKAHIVDDEKKLRGDIEIHAGAISVRDVLVERGEIADDEKFMEIGRVMRDLISDDQGEGAPQTLAVEDGSDESIAADEGDAASAPDDEASE